MWSTDSRQSGRLDALTRVDLHSKNLQDHKQERTDLRVTGDAWNGDIINIVHDINRDEEHSLVEGELRDVVTLLLKSVSGRDDHFSTYNKHDTGGEF